MDHESEFEYLKYLYFIEKFEFVPKNVQFQSCPSHWSYVIVPIAKPRNWYFFNDIRPYEPAPFDKIEIHLGSYPTPYGIRYMGYCKENNVLYIRDPK